MMWNGAYGMMGGGWGLGLFGMLLPLVAFVLFLGFIISLFTHGIAWPGREKGDRLSAGLSIVEERYARGEIGRDEYLQRKRDLLT